MQSISKTELETSRKPTFLGKIVDGYDDFFEFELKKFNEEKNKK